MSRKRKPPAPRASFWDGMCLIAVVLIYLMG